MTLTTYVTAAILEWSHIAHERAESIASDIAEVVSRDDEKPLWGSTAKTALTLASIASHESDFADWVEDGRCNDRVWRRSDEGRALVHKWGSCDGGHAFGLWQAHVEPAVVLVPGDVGWVLLRPGEDTSDAITPEDVLSDRKVAARVALHMVRKSVRSGMGLCGYTGEVERPCPKGEARMKTAVEWYRSHPFE